MQNRTDIINAALQRCGAAGINAAFQDTQEAAIAASAYQRSLRLVLSQYKWTFAMKYEALALNADAPQFGYKNAFTVPSDCVQIIDVHTYEYDDEGEIVPGHLFKTPMIQFERVGKDIYSNHDNIALRYVSDDVDEMPDVFADVLAWRLAFEIAPYIQQGTNQATFFYQMYTQSLDEAKVENDVQQNPERQPDALGSKHLFIRFHTPQERW